MEFTNQYSVELPNPDSVAVGTNMASPMGPKGQEHSSYLSIH